MKVSINVSNYSWQGGPTETQLRLRELLEAADESGIDTVWVSDHLLQADPTATANERDMLEAYTTLGFMAAASERVNLGTMVTAVSFRAPALLVKAVTTLDVLSGGRAWLGIGAGYHTAEAEAMGLPLPPTAERFEQLEDALQIASRMWAGDDSAFEGRQFRLANPVSVPAPLQRPRPRILIGGAGEHKTLRLVAQYGDACNLFDIPDGGLTVRHKLAVLERHCHSIGRTYDEIEKTLSTRLSPGETATEVVERFRKAADIGIGHIVVIRPGAWTPEALQPLVGAIPELSGVAVS
jgi:F420-dependent oxidoreductase-like protein